MNQGLAHLLGPLQEEIEPDEEPLFSELTTLSPEIHAISVWLPEDNNERRALLSEPIANMNSDPSQPPEWREPDSDQQDVIMSEAVADTNTEPMLPIVFPELAGQQEEILSEAITDLNTEMLGLLEWYPDTEQPELYVPDFVADLVPETLEWNPNLEERERLIDLAIADLDTEMLQLPEWQADTDRPEPQISLSLADASLEALQFPESTQLDPGQHELLLLAPEIAIVSASPSPQRSPRPRILEQGLLQPPAPGVRSRSSSNPARLQTGTHQPEGLLFVPVASTGSRSGPQLEWSRPDASQPELQIPVSSPTTTSNVTSPQGWPEPATFLPGLRISLPAGAISSETHRSSGWGQSNVPQQAQIPTQPSVSSTTGTQHKMYWLRSDVNPGDLQLQDQPACQEDRSLYPPHDKRGICGRAAHVKPCEKDHESPYFVCPPCSTSIELEQMEKQEIREMAVNLCDVCADKRIHETDPPMPIGETPESCSCWILRIGAYHLCLACRKKEIAALEEETKPSREHLRTHRRYGAESIHRVRELIRPTYRMSCKNCYILLPYMTQDETFKIEICGLCNGIRRNR